MNIILNGHTKTEYETQFLKQLNFARDIQIPEKKYNIPDSIGKGSISSLPLLNGIDLKWSDMTFHESLTMCSVVDHFHSEFNFCLEGGGNVEIDGKVIDGCMTAGRVQFTCVNYSKGAAYFPKGQRIRHLNIDLNHLFWERMEIDPNGRFNKKYFITDSISSIKNTRIIGEILECPSLCGAYTPPVSGRKSL